MLLFVESERTTASLSAMRAVRGISPLGLALPGLLQAQNEAPPAGIVDDPSFGAAKNIIYLWLQGGPSQHETFDPKPEAPVEIQGEMQAIPTRVSGVAICEHLPRIATIMDRLTVVRSLTHPLTR